MKPEILAGGLDIVVVRELTGGIYFGEKGFKDTDLGPAAYDVEQSPRRRSAASPRWPSTWP